MAAAAAALVAACGGGGGGSVGVGDTPAIQLSGVAATGLALANSAVDVKCASGTGTATTNESGSYTVSVPDGQMPCIVKVTGTANGVPVTLHSLAEGSGTSAIVNVTPLTELILARATGDVPAALFDVFSAGTAPTATALSAATTDILTALGTAAGVDLSGMDPFKGTLVAATASDPTAGNDYDKALDELGKVVSPAMLSAVVSQVATTAGGTSAPMTLEQVVANVGNGSLEGCPQALSGKYHAVDFDGLHDEFELNFKTMLAAGTIKLVANAAQPCEVKVLDSLADGGDNDAGPTTIVFGPSGLGVSRDSRTLAYVFPVQAHSLTSIVGKKWEFVESGIELDEDVTPSIPRQRQWVGEMDVAADGTVSVCDYDNLDFTSCNEANETVSFAQSGSTLLLNYEGTTSPVYGYRAPNGALTLFGGNRDATLQSSFVLTRPHTLQPQAQGEVVRYWNVIQRFDLSRESRTPPVDALFNTITPGSLTVTTSTADSVTRTFPDTSTDTWKLNTPIPGLRKRETPLSYQRVLPGLGMTIGIDGSAGQVHSVSLSRPKAATE